MSLTKPWQAFSDHFGLLAWPYVPWSMPGYGAA